MEQGAEVHVEERRNLSPERLGRGGVHHVAFRVEDEAELRTWIDRITKAGFQNSGFVDRFYFRSLYFRELNGILFELSTDGPGFDTDEPLEHLGESLVSAIPRHSGMGNAKSKATMPTAYTIPVNANKIDDQNPILNTG